MKISEQPAFPMEKFDDAGKGRGQPDYSHPTYKGLTKREYLAGLAMQGILSRSGNWNEANLDFVSKQAVYHADHLLEQLTKQ